MIELLMNINPALYNECVRYINQSIGIVNDKYYRHQHVPYGARFFHPDDPFIGGTMDVYSMTYKANIENRYLSDGYHRVETANAYIYLGWYCNIEMENDSYVKTIREGVVRTKIATEIIFNSPKHIFIDINNWDVYYENERVDFIIYNDGRLPKKGKVMPILYRVAPRPQLNLYSSSTSQFNSIELSKLPNFSPDLILLNKILKKIEREETPIEYVPIKQDNGSEKTEMRHKLDTSYQKWTETLHKIKVCDFCGAEIERELSSKFCHYCGVPLESKEKKNEGAWVNILNSMAGT